jgi:hypothetical protein
MARTHVCGGCVCSKSGVRELRVLVVRLLGRRLNSLYTASAGALLGRLQLAAWLHSTSAAAAAVSDRAARQ